MWMRLFNVCDKKPVESTQRFSWSLVWIRELLFICSLVKLYKVKPLAKFTTPAFIIYTQCNLNFILCAFGKKKERKKNFRVGHKMS